MRIARLDGVRAIAILMVILHHHGFLPAGWVGVDLFFVLSGFLITRILRSTRTQPLYWSNFYIKRAVRILPPLFCVILFCVFVSRHIPIRSIAGYALFMGNFMNLTRFKNGLLGPLWSLAVEEHFYLVWPMVVLLVNRRTLFMILSAILILEPCLRAVMTSHNGDYNWIYNLTPYRLDGLAAGSLLALVTEETQLSENVRRLTGWGALILTALFFLLPDLITGFVREDNTARFNAMGYSIAAFGAVFFVTWVLRLERGFAFAFLSSRPLAYIGRISYGMYLAQTPITSFMRRLHHIPFGTGDASAIRGLLPIDLLLIVAVATVSYRLVERPVMSWGSRLVEDLRDGTEPETVTILPG